MENFPKGYSDVQQTYSGYSTPHPTRRDNGLQIIEARLPRCVQQEIVVAPIAQAERALWNPRQQCQNDADLEAEYDVEDYA